MLQKCWYKYLGFCRNFRICGDSCQVIYHSVDGHVENSPGPHNVKEAVDVLENGDHHLVLILGSRSVESREQSVIDLSCQCFVERKKIKSF